MCSKEIKNEVYRLFDEGLTPTQVIVKLNIPHERRTVSGCYSYYRQKKAIEEESKKANMEYLSSEIDKYKDIHNKQLELLKTAYESLNEIIKLSDELNILNCDKVTSNFGILRQYIIHNIENDLTDDDTRTIEAIRKISKARRYVKAIDYTNKNINTVKGNLKNTKTIIETTINKYEKDYNFSGNPEEFINNRKKLLSDDMLKILEEIM